MVATLRMISMPGASVATMNIDMRSCGFASGSVTTIAIRNEAKRALDENHFSPSITQASPSRVARHTNSFGSAPACGSVIEKDDTMAPSRSGCR